MAHPKCVTIKLPKNGCKASGRDHLGHQVVHMMPHPPPCIWVHPHNQSLQLLYLPTLYYNHCTLLQIYTCGDCATLAPCQVRVPPRPTPVRALRSLSPLVTRLMWGRTSQGTATSCGFRVRLQVIEGEMLLSLPCMHFDHRLPW